MIRLTGKKSRKSSKTRICLEESVKREYHLEPLLCISINLVASYGRIVSRIFRKAPKKIIQRSKQILGMIAAARRSLYLHEVQGALAINLANKDVNFEERQLRTHLKDICGSLIELQGDRRIQFIHPTAKE
jgi:hypothetical protein